MPKPLFHLIRRATHRHKAFFFRILENLPWFVFARNKINFKNHQASLTCIFAVKCILIVLQFPWQWLHPSVLSLKASLQTRKWQVESSDWASSCAFISLLSALRCAGSHTLKTFVICLQKNPKTNKQTKKANPQAIFHLNLWIKQNITWQDFQYKVLDHIFALMSCWLKIQILN